MKKVSAAFGILAGIALVVYATFFLTTQFYTGTDSIGGERASASEKMAEIESLLASYFIDDYDVEAIGDAAAAAAIAATGDRWSYYIPASQYDAYEEHVQNGYAGIGITISQWDNEGFPVTSVSDDSPAARAGICVGDKLIRADGDDLAGMDFSDVQNIVRGDPGTKISLSFLRDGEEFDVTLKRAVINVTVAVGEMVTDEIGCITILNFDNNSAKQTIAAIEEMLNTSAKALIFDVRSNPGGMRSELVEILDYLLPEGDVFCGVSYDGVRSVDRSDASCVALPMVVLVDADSYSAAEFFAAALQEESWATIVGEQTCGKGNFQYTFPLSDGSAVAISVGKYFTKSGRSLDGVGVTPDEIISLSNEDKSALYLGELPVEDDLQLQRAIEILTKKIA